MALGITDLDELRQLVNDYKDFDEFVFDVETKNPENVDNDVRLDTSQNVVFWISLAGPGRADVIPCGHPLGERILFDPEDTQHRIAPNGHTQERRINPDSGREKWFDIPPPFTKAPKQLWVSQVMKELKPLMFSSRRKIGHNVKFDLESVAKYLGGIPPGPYGDTLIASRLVNENYFGYRLGDIVKRHFKFEYDKSKGKNLEKHPYSEAYAYSYLDSKYCWLSWERLKPLLTKEKVEHVLDLEMELVSVTMDMEMTGIPIDAEVLAALGREFQLELARLQIAIDDVAGWDINLNAKRQVGKLIYDVLGHECYVFTKTGERSTAAATLESYSKDKTVQKILEHAKLSKLQGTFVEGIQRAITEDGRVHPSFAQEGARSGRFTCKQPNVQQVPSRTERGKRVRDVFIAGKGNVLVVSDLSQIELRTLAHFTQDPLLLEAYQLGLDLHSITAERVFGKDFTPTQRSLAKNGNFSVLFGAGPGTMVKKYDFPNVRVAKQVLDGFYATYRRVKPWKVEILDEARSRRKKGTPPYVETILGRKRRLPALLWLNDMDRKSAERQAISTVVSGSAADLFKVIMLDTYKSLQDVDWNGHILMTVHDELVVEVPERYADEGLKLVKSCMESAHNPLTGEPFLTVPLVADAKVVDRWSAAK